jgi:5'-3' exonuclease
MESVLLEQIPILEDALRAMGVTVWAMEEFEADDALASAAAIACEDRTVHKVLILTPDKDLGQCVQGKRVVQFDRRNNIMIDEAAVVLKFGVGPSSIADYLGLVGDTADGFPGLQGWGAKSASTVLAKYGTIDKIPDNHEQWIRDGVAVRSAEKLAIALSTNRTEAALFKQLATLITTVPVGSIADWKWAGPTVRFEKVAEKLGAPQLVERLAKVQRSI